MPKIERHAEISQADSDFLTALLNEHARGKGIIWNPQPLNLLLRDGDVLMGGLHGTMLHGWLFIRHLAVAPQLRGQGYGRMLVQEAESAAIAHDCHSVWLDTFSFQAPDFYRGLGYKEFGALDAYPDKEKRMFFAKNLARPLRPIN